MATNLIPVEVAARHTVIAQGRLWCAGQTVWLPADDVPTMEAQGFVVAIGSYVPSVFTA